MRNPKPLYLLGVFCALFLFAAPSHLFAQYGSVSRSGSTWTATANGTTVYSGNRMFDAINAACNNAGNGALIDIWNSGDSGPDGGDIYAIRPLPGQTLDFHGHTINCNGGEFVVPIYADRRHDITIRNVHITGNPRYALWFRGCFGGTFHNISLDTTSGLGIRYDDSTGPAGDLTISGNIYMDGNGTSGHHIETYGVDGFSIGDVTVNNNNGSGVLLNNSSNGTVGNVSGTGNNWGGGYATFRVANNNGPNVTVQSVYSRDSGRGVFSVSGSSGTTINSVDIADTWSHGIFLENSSNTHILSGNVCGGNPNIQEVNTSNTTINVSICGSGGGSNQIADGTYRLRNRANGLYLDNLGQGANGAGVGQWSGSSSPNQRWNVSTASGNWRKLQVVSTGHYLDSLNNSSDGSNVGQWSNSSHNNQQWEIEHVTGNYYRIVNRNNGKAVDTGGQNSNGDTMQHWFVNSSHNQQWEFISVQ
ncbi:MAG: RICIN domain-containing protein [Opitutales bacterium]|nr:RICIN domain-containing protein [Opitutales bacterium]